MSPSASRFCSELLSQPSTAAVIFFKFSPLPQFVRVVFAGACFAGGGLGCARRGLRFVSLPGRAAISLFYHVQSLVNGA